MTLTHRRSEKIVVSTSAVLLLFILTVIGIYFSPQIQNHVQHKLMDRTKLAVPETSVISHHKISPIALSDDVGRIPFLSVRKVWESVVYISRNSATDESAGSAVIIGFDPKRRVAAALTAAHVARCEEPSHGCHLHIYFPVNGAFVAEDAKIISIDTVRDEALITAPVPRFARIAVANKITSSAAVGPVIAIGFPNLDTRTTWSAGKPAGPAKFVRRFSLGFREAGGGGHREVGGESTLRFISSRLVHYADVLPGDSGGGLFSADGSLLGILTQIEYLNPEASVLKPMCTRTASVCRNIAHLVSPQFARAVAKLSAHPNRSITAVKKIRNRFNFS